MDYEYNPILANELATTSEKLNPEQLDKLYKRHQKVTFRWYCTKNTRALALTKRLVELVGGKIWVESQGKDKGSKFRFIIPA